MAHTPRIICKGSDLDGEADKRAATRWKRVEAPQGV